MAVKDLIDEITLDVSDVANTTFEYTSTGATLSLPIFGYVLSK